MPSTRMSAGLAGPVTVSGATGEAVISGPEISGPVTVLANDTGYAPIVVTGNTVGARCCAAATRPHR